MVGEDQLLADEPRYLLQKELFEHVAQALDRGWRCASLEQGARPRSAPSLRFVWVRILLETDLAWSRRRLATRASGRCGRATYTVAVKWKRQYASGEQGEASERRAAHRTRSRRPRTATQTACRRRGRAARSLALPKSSPRPCRVSHRLHGCPRGVAGTDGPEQVTLLRQSTTGRAIKLSDG